MFKAAEHRVRATPSSSPERFSVPFFFNPDYDALVEPVLLLQDDSSHVANNNSSDNGIEMCEQVHTQESEQKQLQEQCISIINNKHTQYKHYKPIRWGDFRWLRFLGDHSDRGREVQIEDYIQYYRLDNVHIQHANDEAVIAIEDYKASA